MRHGTHCSPVRRGEVDAAATCDHDRHARRYLIVANRTLGGHHLIARIRGALARVAVANVAPNAPGGWPWGTMTVNLTGALLLGLVLGVVQDAVDVGRWVKPLVGTGIIGGYTTFSTLSVETLALAADGRVLTAVAYVVLSAVAGLVAIWAGSAVVRARRHGRGGR